MAEHDNVVEFHGATRLDIDADRVLDAARDAGLVRVVVLGYDADGDEYIASSIASGPDTLWLLDIAKSRLMAAAIEEDD